MPVLIKENLDLEKMALVPIKANLDPEKMALVPIKAKLMNSNKKTSNPRFWITNT